MSAIEKAVKTYIDLRTNIQGVEAALETLRDDYRTILKHENVGGDLNLKGAERVYEAYKKIQERIDKHESDEDALKEAEEVIIDYLKSLDGNRLVYSYLKQHQIQNTIFSFYLNGDALECDPPMDA